MFKLMDKIFMYFNRRYFCKKELKENKCDKLHKQCCMYRDICKL